MTGPSLSVASMNQSIDEISIHKNSPRFVVVETSKNVEKKPIDQWARYSSVNRSQWIKDLIKPIPSPDKYSKKTFIEYLTDDPLPITYGFKNEGRKKTVNYVVMRERAKIPAYYDFQGFGDLLNKKQSNYSFKVRRRRTKDMLRGVTDLNINLDPGNYENQNYLAINPDNSTNNITTFRSKTKRLPSKEFMEKLGPSPGEYDFKLPDISLPITSSFKSKSGRFNYPNYKYPGPGTYDKSYMSPPPLNLRNLGRQHGLFFSTSFCA